MAFSKVVARPDKAPGKLGSVQPHTHRHWDPGGIIYHHSTEKDANSLSTLSNQPKSQSRRPWRPQGGGRPQHKRLLSGSTRSVPWCLLEYKPIAPANVSAFKDAQLDLKTQKPQNGL